MRRRLILLRHGKSGYPAGVADHDRPLASRGRREAPLAGTWLNEHHQGLPLILSSTATRALQTAELVRAEFRVAPDLRTDGRLYGAEDDEIMAVVRELPGDLETVLVVGHNPGLQDLIATLANTWYPMRTSSIAVLSGPGGWDAVAPGWATLDEALTPRPGD